jgi:hypothetical protein
MRVFIVVARASISGSPPPLTVRPVASEVRRCLAMQRETRRGSPGREAWKYEAHSGLAQDARLADVDERSALRSLNKVDARAQGDGRDRSRAGPWRPSIIAALSRGRCISAHPAPPAHLVRSRVPPVGAGPNGLCGTTGVAPPCEDPPSRTIGVAPLRQGRRTEGNCRRLVGRPRGAPSAQIFECLAWAPRCGCSPGSRSRDQAKTATGSALCHLTRRISR